MNVAVRRGAVWLTLAVALSAGCEKRDVATSAKERGEAPPASTSLAAAPSASGANESSRADDKGGALKVQAAKAPAPGVAGKLDNAASKPGDPLGNTIAPMPTAAGETLVPIDPNGRFATTYRPGGGHLAAFESAVARGIIPDADREIVSDVGARYAPAMDAPKSGALAIRTDLERTQLPPTGSPIHLRIALRGTDKATAERPHLSVHLVLDVSGSMAGESITRARDAARMLVDKLAPTDDFSFVTFSSDAEVKVPDGPIGPRKDSIKKTIDQVHEGGGTNISKGLQLGYEQALTKGIPDDAVRVVLLLSDGRANAGITGTDRISHLALDAFQKGIQTSSFGLGADYDGALMASIANDGAGGYYYLRDAEQIAPAISTEVEKRLDPVATAVEVRVRLKKGVDLLKVYGSRRLDQAEAAKVRTQEVAIDEQSKKRDHIDKDRQDDNEGGMRFFIPAFARNDSHAMLLRLKLPEGAGTKPVAMIELKYKDRVSKKNVSDEVPIAISYANDDAASAATADASVLKTIQGFAAGDALADASVRIANGDRAGALAVLTEREGILRQAADTLKEPLFLKDADRLARLKVYAGKEDGVGDPLVLAMLLQTAAHSHLR